jgi:hypothetical protein
VIPEHLYSNYSCEEANAVSEMLFLGAAASIEAEVQGAGKD